MIDFILYIGTGFCLAAGGEAIGAYTLRFLGMPSDCPKAIAWGVGMVWLSAFLIILGSTGGYAAPAFWAIWAFYFAAAVIRAISMRKIWLAYFWKEGNLSSSVYQVCIAVMLIVCLGTVFTPETRSDPYDYHLSTPNLYLAYGKIVEITWHVFTYMPKNGEILYGFALGLGDDSLAKLIHYLFGVFILLALGSFVKQLLHPEAGWLAAQLAATLPLFGFLATSAYIDLIRAFWELMALWFLYFVWREEKEAMKSRCLLFSCFFAGMAMGTKYVAWLVFFIPYTFLLILTLRNFSVRRWLRLLFPAAVLGLLPMLPWLIYNAVWTGNPVYPLMPTLFGTHTPAAGQAYDFFRHHAPAADTYSAGNILPFWLNRVWLLLLDGNALLILGGASLLASVWWKKIGIGAQLPGYVFAGLSIHILLSFLLFSLFVDNNDGRFFASTLILLAIPAVFSLYAVRDALQNMESLQRFLLPAAAMVFFFNAITYRYVQLQDLKESVLPMFSAEQRSDFLTKRFFAYPAIEWANGHLPLDAYVLGIGYPLQRKHISGIKYGYLPFLENLPETIEASELAKRLSGAGITHLVEPFPNLAKNLDLSILKPDYLIPVYRHRRTSIYLLRKPDASG
ncbi:MAG: glycosyltransferase family 39 protein [Candidatus Omnitrophota bacterium]